MDDKQIFDVLQEAGFVGPDNDLDHSLHTYGFLHHPDNFLTILYDGSYAIIYIRPEDVARELEVAEIAFFQYAGWTPDEIDLANTYDRMLAIQSLRRYYTTWDVRMPYQTLADMLYDLAWYLHAEGVLTTSEAEEVNLNLWQDIKLIEDDYWETWQDWKYDDRKGAD